MLDGGESSGGGETESMLVGKDAGNEVKIIRRKERDHARKKRKIITKRKENQADMQDQRV